jgi:hypothetical protein
MILAHRRNPERLFPEPEHGEALALAKPARFIGKHRVEAAHQLDRATQSAAASAGMTSLAVAPVDPGSRK